MAWVVVAVHDSEPSGRIPALCSSSLMWPQMRSGDPERPLKMPTKALDQPSGIRAALSTYILPASGSPSASQKGAAYAAPRVSASWDNPEPLP